MSVAECLSAFLPKSLTNALVKVNLSLTNELRLRVAKPAIVIANGAPFYLSESGITKRASEAIIISKTMLADIVFRASECSIYSSNEQIRQGFITVEGGIRVGIAGESVISEDKCKTIKNYTSLNIRFPHKINGCSLQVLPLISKNHNLLNTLIISPPGCGKTTMLRDIIEQSTNFNYYTNVLLIDERNEINGGINSMLINNAFCDIISNTPKAEAILQGIRVMSPNVIITDEIATSSDSEALLAATTCGVKIIATIHGENIDDIKNKHDLKNLFDANVFERYVLLSSDNGPGTVCGVYDKNYERVGMYDN